MSGRDLGAARDTARTLAQVNDKTATRDLLFELRTEELPPRTLLALSTALSDGMVKGLDGAGVAHGRVHSFATPRRLAVLIKQCAEFAAARRVERRGPPVAASFDAAGAPTQAATAFAKSCGVEVESLERLTTDKGVWLAYRGSEPGVATVMVLSALIHQALTALPIAKRMRWGGRNAEFVRPVRGVVLLFGDEVVPIEVLGLTAGRMTVGHRFHAPKPLSLPSPKSYERRLRGAKVVADFAKRRELIRAGVIAAAAESGGTALMEAALLDEVTALVEWPVPIAGRFEQRFLALPREVVIATVQDHQRYFPVQGLDGRLTGGFVTVSNLESRDPSKVREGNERVVRPRLSDAAFFLEQDRKQSLQDHAARLAGVIFQTKLGSYAEKTRRVVELARCVVGRISAESWVGPFDGTLIERAAELAKADLMSAMVGEFPELQGIMGRYYAEAEGEPAEVAIAIEEHYRPRFAGDALPVTPTGQALAIADKLDTIAGIFAIEQRPTGTKDPFGLRRAALGVLRILLEGRLELNLVELIEKAVALQPVQRPAAAAEVGEFMAERLRGLLLERMDGNGDGDPGEATTNGATAGDMIDAVLAARPPSPLDAEARLLALREFLPQPEAAVLTAVNKRIANILRKTPAPAGRTVNPAALIEEAERDLHRSLADVGAAARTALSERRYADALRSVARLGGVVDRFFEHIMVMDQNPERRNNRLALLDQAQSLLGAVADLSQLPG